MAKFFKRINWRQVLIHFLAAWPIIYAFKLLSALSDIFIFKSFIPGNKPEFLQAINEGQVSLEEFTRYVYITNTFGFWGYLLAFLISLTISIRRNWFWVNSIIASFGIYMIYLNPLGQKYTTGWHTTIYPNLIPTSIFWYVVTAGLCLAVGLWLFFSRRANNFIGQTAWTQLIFRAVLNHSAGGSSSVLSGQQMQRTALTPKAGFFYCSASSFYICIKRWKNENRDLTHW